MPNYCENNLELRATEGQERAYISVLAEMITSSINPRFFSEVIPEPPDLANCEPIMLAQKEGLLLPAQGIEAFVKLPQATQDSFRKRAASHYAAFRKYYIANNLNWDSSPIVPEDVYGMPLWWYWRISHWGTKWEFMASHLKDNKTQAKDLLTFDPATGELLLDLAFDTAWMPPTLVYDRLQEIGISVTAAYADLSGGFFGLYDDGKDQQHDAKVITKDTDPEDYHHLLVPYIQSHIEFLKET